MKVFTVSSLVLTLAITTFARPNFIPDTKQDGSGWTISKTDNKPKPVHNPIPIWHPQPPKPVNPWKPTSSQSTQKSTSTRHSQTSVTHQPTLSWSAPKTSTVVHLPTQSVGHHPWKRNEHFEPKPYHGGGGGKMNSVTWKPWQPPKVSSTSSSSAVMSITSPSSAAMSTTSSSTATSSSTPTSYPEQPGKGNGNGWNPPPGHGNGNGWPKPDPKPEPGNGWHVARPHDTGFGEHSRAINDWKRDDVLEA